MNTKIDNAKITLIILLILFIIGFAIVLWLNITKKNTPKTTNVPVGSFAVNPGVTALSTRPIVGVNNLQDATNKCLVDKECKSFIYDENSKTYQIVDLTAPKTKDLGKDLYTLQIGIKYVN